MTSVLHPFEGVPSQLSPDPGWDTFYSTRFRPQNLKDTDLTDLTTRLVVWVPKDRSNMECWRPEVSDFVTLKHDKSNIEPRAIPGVNTKHPEGQYFILIDNTVPYYDKYSGEPIANELSKLMPDRQYSKLGDAVRKALSANEAYAKLVSKSAPFNPYAPVTHTSEGLSDKCRALADSIASKGNPYGLAAIDPFANPRTGRYSIYAHQPRRQNSKAQP